MPDTDVVRVTVKDGAATGVEVRARDGRAQAITARQVVLACGAIHTPAVLVRSGIGPKSVLESLGVAETRILEGVGRNLMDHPAIAPTAVPKPGLADWDQPVIQTTLYYTTPGGDFNDVQIEPLSFMHIRTEAPILYGLAACVFKSYSRGELRFESADVDARPRAYMNYFSDERDFIKIKDGMLRAIEMLNTNAVAAVSDGVARPRPDEVADTAHIDAWIRRNSGTGAHPACTAMMGADDDPLAVCDDHAFVRGIANLRIADASLMPVVPRVNTNIPTIMIGERISDWVREDLS
jgi:choline dehydrogenase